MEMKMFFRKFGLAFVLLPFLWMGCSSSDDAMPGYIEGFPHITTPPPEGMEQLNNPASIGLTGNAEDVETETRLGIVIMGGGADVDSAIQWMIQRSGGGDVVVLRASGTEAYNRYIFSLGTVNSVETLLIDSRALANNETVANTIRNAEMLFIAGGDQSDYMEFWRDTKVHEAIDYLANEKGVPIGGTSAGAAILGGLYYSGENGSITSEAALEDPFNSRITLYDHDFLDLPFLNQVITDQHFSQRDRWGRLTTFLGRFLTDKGLDARGIGVDESTAVAIDEEGKAVVFGNHAAYFLKTDISKTPETIGAGQSLTWNRGEEAVKVYRIAGSRDGAGSFDVADFDENKADGGTKAWWWVQDGKLNSKKR